MTYKHGAFAKQMPSSEVVSPEQGGLLPVYIGVAPVHQLQSDPPLEPVLINTFDTGVRAFGYNDSKWEQYQLSEVLYAHFKNQIGPIGPIVFINVLNPSTHKTAEKTAEVELTAGQGYIENEKVILNTLSVTGKVKGTDYTVSYTSDGSKVLFQALTEMVSPVSVKFCEVDLSKVTAAVVQGTVNESLRTGIKAISRIYPSLNRIPNLIAAPGWSDLKSVRDEMIAASHEINGHWESFVFTDLPSDENTNTIQKAIAYKKANGYTAANESPCWPCAKNGSRVFRLSTLSVVEACRQASLNDGYPSESPSNKAIDVTAVCLKNGAALNFDQIEANELNQNGIKTAIFFGGEHVIWGPHTGAYEYGKAMEPSDIFDASKMMSIFVLNDFQMRYASKIDRTMRRSAVDTIMNDYQERMDSMPILYSKVEFLETSNDVDDMISGDFIFDVSMTPSAIGKSITANLRYTAKGFESLFGGE